MLDRFLVATCLLAKLTSFACVNAQRGTDEINAVVSICRELDALCAEASQQLQLDGTVTSPSAALGHAATNLVWHEHG